MEDRYWVLSNPLATYRDGPPWSWMSCPLSCCELSMLLEQNLQFGKNIQTLNLSTLQIHSLNFLKYLSSLRVFTLDSCTVLTKCQLKNLKHLKVYTHLSMHNVCNASTGEFLHILPPELLWESLNLGGCVSNPTCRETAEEYYRRHPTLSEMGCPSFP